MSTRKFQISITKELEVTKNRVRDLIGDVHWGEEGRYKEEVVKSSIRKFLPNTVSVGTGFIKTEFNISKQLDLIVYDNTKPLLFSEGDFIITTPSNILGVVEVKSKQNVTQLRDTISTFEHSIRIINEENVNRIFYGILSLDYDGDILDEGNRFNEILRESSGLINHMSLGKDKFVRLWGKEDGERLNPIVETDNDFYNTYDIVNLSYSYFIANLVHIASGNPVDRYWFSFPLEETKEAHRINTIKLQNA